MHLFLILMIDAKTLSEEQKAQIQVWADEGAGLSGIQKRLADEFGIKVTYMETRFLIGDLAIQMPEEETPAPAGESAVIGGDPEEIPEAGEIATSPDGGADPAAEDGGANAGSVTVTISELQRPGAVVNGTVTFAGGKKADWWMDQLGRLGMDPKDPEFRPSETDMINFQKELQKVAQEKGF